MKNEAFDEPAASAAPARGLLQKPRAKGDWLERLHNYYWVSYLRWLPQDLPLWILHWHGKKGLTWMALNEVGRVQPFHFELQPGKGAERDDYFWESLEGRRATASSC